MNPPTANALYIEDLAAVSRPPPASLLGELKRQGLAMAGQIIGRALHEKTRGPKHPFGDSIMSARIVGNSLYHSEIQHEMDRRGCNMQTAEIEVFHHTVKTLRDEGWTHQQIQEHLGKAWGMKRSAYRVRLQRVRARYVLK